jgi:type II secretory pathway pseudopilin PulG
MSAAAQITIFLLGIIITSILATIAGFVGWQWWRERQERRRLEKAARQAELYRLLNGTGQPHIYSRPRSTSLPQSGGNILVFPGGGPRNPPMVQDWRHDDWEVTQ